MSGPSKRKRSRERLAERELRQAEQLEAEWLAQDSEAGAGLIAVSLVVLVYFGGLIVAADVWADLRESLVELLRARPFSLPHDAASAFLMTLGGFPLFFAFASLFGGYGERARGRLRTARTSGEVVESNVVIVPNLSGDRATRSERQVRVVYHAEGHRYEASFQYGTFPSLQGPKSLGPVAVYYQPSLPTNAGLRPGWRERAYGAGLCIVVCGALAMAGLLERSW